MRNLYWGRKKKENGEPDIVILRRKKTMEFTYEGENYMYSYTSDAATGYILITSGTGIIYDTRDSEKCKSELGLKLHNLIMKKNV